MQRSSSRNILLSLSAAAIVLCAPALRAQGAGGPPPTGRSLGGLSLGGASHSDADRLPPRRTISGFVADSAGNHLPGAVVYLKDTAKSSVIAINAADDGSYRFGALPLTQDYEVWAVVNGKKSTVKPVSSFLTQNQITILLKIDK